MSEDLNNNERYLKEVADKYKIVPPPVVWDEIEQELDKDKGKRRLYPILWIFGVLAIGALLFISLKEQKDKEPLIVEREIAVSDDQKQSDPNLQDVRSVEPATINEVKQGENVNFSEEVLAVSDNQEEEKVNPEKPNPLVTHQPQLSNFNTAGLDSSFNANTISSNGTDANHVVALSSPLRGVRGDKVTIGFTPNATAVLAKEDVSTPVMPTQSIVEDRNTIGVPYLQRPKRIRRLVVPRIPLPDSSENLTGLLVSEPKGNALLSSPWFVELRGGIGKNLSNPVLLDNTQGGYRFNTESRWYSWSASMQLGYQFDDRWYTTIGFDLNQTKHRFDFWRRGISSLIVSENQRFQITNSDFFNIGEISYTFADIGLSLGRRVNIDKWHFSLEGGAILNVLFNAKGKVQVGGLEFSRLEDQEAYFNTQVGMGARLSAMLDLPVSDQMWISVGPSYHQYFNTVSSGENPLRERNSILQVMAKVRCHF